VDRDSDNEQSLLEFIARNLPSLHSMSLAGQPLTSRSARMPWGFGQQLPSHSLPFVLPTLERLNIDRIQNDDLGSLMDAVPGLRILRAGGAQGIPLDRLPPMLEEADLADPFNTPLVAARCPRIRRLHLGRRCVVSCFSFSSLTKLTVFGE
jgi:hypothetical protein